MITIQLLLPVPESKLRLLLNEWGVKLGSDITKIELIELILVNAPAKRDAKKYQEVLNLVKKYQ